MQQTTRLLDQLTCYQEQIQTTTQGQWQTLFRSCVTDLKDLVLLCDTCQNSLQYAIGQTFTRLQRPKKEETDESGLS